MMDTTAHDSMEQLVSHLTQPVEVQVEEPSAPVDIPLRAPQPHQVLRLTVTTGSSDGYTVAVLGDDIGAVSEEAPSPPPLARTIRDILEKYRQSFREHNGPRLRERLRADLWAAAHTLYPSLLPVSIADVVFDLWEPSQPFQLHLTMPAELESIPWEYVADIDGYILIEDVFYLSHGQADPAPSTGRRTRRGKAATAPTLPPLMLPLRLLVVVSSPLDLPEERQLDADRELRLIRQALDEPIQRGEIEVQVEDEANWPRLDAALKGFRPHILHFTGHGYADGSGLVWEDPDGNTSRRPAPDAGQDPIADPLDGARLADLVVGQDQLRLVVLSACRGAHADGEGAFSSVAATLLRLGTVPAVIAMQDSILDASAISFARHFYGGLAQGQSVEHAMWEARRAMAAMGPDGQRGLEWGLPILLTNHPGAALFSFDRQQPPRRLVRQGGDGLYTPDAYFVGRQAELRRGRAALEGDQKRLTIITGPGGFGKSALAARLVERTAGHFRCAYVADCRAWNGLTFLLRSVGLFLAQQGYPALLNAVQTPEMGLAQQVGVLVDALNAGPHLLILDNFEDLLDMTQEPFRPGGPRALTTLEDMRLEAFLERLMQGLRRGKAIITSRYAFEFTAQGRGALQIEEMPLQHLTWREAQRLMGTTALAEANVNDLYRLYTQGADSPILIEWLAAEAGAGRLDGLLAEISALGQRFSERFLLDKLYAALDERGQELLRRGAVYNQPVPREFWSRQQAGANLEPLQRRSLVYQEGATYRQHEIVRQFALERLETNEGIDGVRAAHARAAEHYEYFARETSHDLSDYLAAKDHFLTVGLVAEAVRLVQDLNPVLALLGLWRLGLHLNQELSTLVRDGGEEITLLVRADLLKNQADRLMQLGQVREALDYYAEALALVEQAHERRARGAILVSLGVAYRSLGKYRRAISSHEQALAIFQQIGDREGEGSALGNLGSAYFSLGEYRRAISSHEQCLAIAQQIGNRQGEGNALSGLGLAYNSLGEYRRAISCHEQHLTIVQQIGDREGEGNALGNLGLAYRSLGEYRRAISSYEQHLAIAQQIGDRHGEGNALGGLGNAYFSLGEYRHAISYHEQHLIIAQQIGDRLGEDNALGNLGNAYLSLGEYRRAISSYEQCLAIAQQIGDRQGEGNALGGLGSAYHSLGEYRRAISSYEQCLIIAQQIGYRLGEGSALSNLGNAYLSLGEYAQALSSAVPASLLLLQIHSPASQQVFTLLRRLHQALGHDEFERLAAAAYATHGMDYAAYRAVLEQSGIFAPTALSSTQRRLAWVLSHAAAGEAPALDAAHQLMEGIRARPEGAMLAVTVDLLLAGGRASEVLLGTSRGLDEVDHAVVELVLAALADPEVLRQLDAEVEAESAQELAIDAEQRAAIEQFLSLSEAEQLATLATGNEGFGRQPHEAQCAALQNLVAQLRQQLVAQTTDAMDDETDENQGG